MKTKRFFLLLLPFLLFLLPLWVGADPPADQCISCHTDDQKMKSLVRMPTLHSEGEG